MGDGARYSALLKEFQALFDTTGAKDQAAAAGLLDELMSESTSEGTKMGKQLSRTKPRNPRHFDGIEGGRREKV